MRRVRGPGGRFLTKAELNQYRKQLEAQDPEGATAPAPLPGTGKKNQVREVLGAGGEFIARLLCCIFIVCLLVAFQTDWIRTFEPSLDYLSPARSVSHGRLLFGPIIT